MPMEIITPVYDIDFDRPCCPFCKIVIKNNLICDCWRPIRWATFTDNELKGYRYITDNADGITEKQFQDWYNWYKSEGD